MNKELFQIVVFKDKPLRNLIFQCIRFIHREIIKSKSYKLKQLVNEKPSLLAYYERVDSVKIIEVISLIIRYAAKNNIIDTIIDWLLNTKKVDPNVVKYTLCDESVYRAAFESGNLEFVQCIYEKSGKVLPKSMYCKISNESQYEIFLWLHQLYLEETKKDQEYRLTSNSIDYAIEIGSLERVKWLWENRNCDVSMYVKLNAIQASNLEIIKYIHSKIGIIRDKHIMLAHKFSSLPVIQWLCDNNTGSINWHFVMIVSSERGNIELLQRVHQNCLEVDCTTDPMDKAASCGHLEVVKFLHSNRPEGCSFKAMDGAAGNGHMETLKWLHQNRSEGCTKNAIDDASKNGHLKVVKWLLENRTEGCTKKAIDNAVLNDHLEIVRFLIEHCNEGYTKASWLNASRNGNIEILGLLHANPKESFAKIETDLISCTFQKGKFLASTWLLENKSDSLMEIDSDYFKIVKNHDFKTIDLICRNKPNSIQKFFDTANQINETEVVQWLKKTYNNK